MHTARCSGPARLTTGGRPRRRGFAVYQAAIALGLLTGSLAPAGAGGPILVQRDGQPFRWSQETGMRYAVDAGAFGSRPHAWAVAAVEQAFLAWQQSPGSRLRIEAARELTTDITGRNVEAFLDGLTAASASPVLLDSDGSILDALLGPGAAEGVLGIGFPYLTDEQTGRIQVGVAILNGALHSVFSDRFAQGNFIHELGHSLNLGHSQVNAEALYDGDPDNESDCPAMFYRGPNDPGGLHADDQAWFTWLYPGDVSGLGSIRGRVLLPDGSTGLRGVHVIARRIDDPQGTAISGVSGYAFRRGDGGVSDPNRLGEFLIPSLPPGSYTLELKQLDSFPGVSVRAAFLPGGQKFWREGSSAQDPPAESTPIVVNAGQQVTGIDILVNGEALGEAKAITEQEPNSPPAGQPVSVPAIISGELRDFDDPVREGTGAADDAHDLYRVTLREWTTITAVLTAAQRGADLDLNVLYLENQSFFALEESTEPGTPPEVVQLRLPPGRYYFGVHRAGERGSAYTLQLSATPSPPGDSEADAAWINYLIIGDVTRTGATLRWQTTGDTTAVAYYNRPLREVGSKTRAREHAMTLTEMPAGTRADVEIYAASPGGVDLTFAPLRTATDPAPDGEPRIVVGRDAYFVSLDLWEMEVRLSNPGDGDARDVRIDQVTPAPGWAVLSTLYSAVRFPETLEVGGIGAGGAGVVLIRLIRLRGLEEPDVQVRGSYSDAAGRVRRF